MMALVETNWAGNYTYGAARISHPASLEELQETVVRADRVRALGTRHSFNSLADSAGELVCLDELPTDVVVDPTSSSVSLGGAIRYGVLAEQLHAEGWALPNLASLPHISVAGAVATGTHGSGDRNGCLSSSVRALDLVGADGELRALRRGDPGFDGSVVSLGALGVVTRLELDIEPTYDVAGAQFTDLPWSVLEDHLDDVTGAGYSVSLFTRWGATVDQVWVKSRGSEPPEELFGAARSARTLHMLHDAPVKAVTEQGVAGPWHERLAHFRMEFTPSRGEELQSEYFVPRERALEAVAAMRGLEPVVAPLLQVSEIRTIAADDQWLSGCYGRESVGIHFTWVRDQPAVERVLPDIERELLPLGARPHWGKCSTASPPQVAAAFPRAADFAALRESVDPSAKFGNAVVDAFVSTAQVRGT
jgi:xylitol oxidase